LEVIDGPFLGIIISQFNKGKAALPACVAVEGQAALAHFAVLAEEIKQILAFCLEREVADVDGHSIKKPGTDSTDVRVLVGRPVTAMTGPSPWQEGDGLKSQPAERAVREPVRQRISFIVGQRLPDTAKGAAGHGHFTARLSHGAPASSRKPENLKRNAL
jgi:hypothetical protein